MSTHKTKMRTSDYYTIWKSIYFIKPQMTTYLTPPELFWCTVAHQIHLSWFSLIPVWSVPLWVVDGINRQFVHIQKLKLQPGLNCPISYFLYNLQLLQESHPLIWTDIRVTIPISLCNLQPDLLSILLSSRCHKCNRCLLNAYWWTLFPLHPGLPL